VPSTIRRISSRFPTHRNAALPRGPRPLDLSGGGETSMKFTELMAYLRARFEVEEGQTMAEYGVVLAVIALGVVVALGVLSGAISGALDRVQGFL
jgi:Flp pilus assembly pilin Flp